MKELIYHLLVTGGIHAVNPQICCILQKHSTAWVRFHVGVHEDEERSQRARCRRSDRRALKMLCKRRASCKRRTTYLNPQTSLLSFARAPTRRVVSSTNTIKMQCLSTAWRLLVGVLGLLPQGELSVKSSRGQRWALNGWTWSCLVVEVCCSMIKA